jgi:transcriptional regulator with PAS, ATPase and Fis domain
MNRIWHEFVGDSRAIGEVIDLIGTVAPTKSTVLIRGESGTGKELAARAIHRNSGRGAGPFVPINAAGMPDQLLESELFGYEKGAFTDARAQKTGLIEMAAGGTLFLDEVGDMSMAAQVRLLRVLQERTVRRLGGTRDIPVDLRIVAATNRDLEAAIQTNAFRMDLYFRLRVFSITMPALRERPEDILPLALHFVERFAKEHGRPVRGISSEARYILRRYDWPGNIRELENAIEAAVIRSKAEEIQAAHLPTEIVLTPPRSLVAGEGIGMKKIKELTEHWATENALVATGGDYRKTAHLLKVHEKSIHRHVEKMQLSHLLKPCDEMTNEC